MHFFTAWHNLSLSESTCAESTKKKYNVQNLHAQLEDANKESLLTDQDRISRRINFFNV